MERQLEDRVAHLIKSIGYEVTRNPRLRGRSGLYHRPDIMFEAEGKKFIIEYKTSFSRQDVLSVYGKATDFEKDNPRTFYLRKRIPMHNERKMRKLYRKGF